MNQEFITHCVAICDHKIQTKGEQVWLSFYVFFQNKNSNPDLLIRMATRRIVEHKLNHFEKALKIKKLLVQI